MQDVVPDKPHENKVTNSWHLGIIDIADNRKGMLVVEIRMHQLQY